MTGTYKIDENRVSMMKGAERFSWLKMMIVVFAVLMIAAFFRKDQDEIPYAMLIIVFVVIILLGLGISYLFRGPLYTTEIEITERGVIRRGDGVSSIELSFDEIFRSETKDIGTLFFKKGVMSKIEYYSTKYPLARGAGVLFVPVAIENYEAIVQHIKRKSKNL